MGNVSQLMHAGRYYVPAITDASSGYKSQKRDGQKEEEGETREERRDRGGKRMRRNREAERKTGRQSEERKERIQKKKKPGADKQKQEKPNSNQPPSLLYPLTFRTRGKGIKQKKQKQRKKLREKVQNNKKNARLELSSSSVFLEIRCVRLHFLLNLQISITLCEGNLITFALFMHA
jgi:hypothetical protein